MNTKGELIELVNQRTNNLIGYRISTECHVCGKVFVSPLFQYDQYVRWQNGAHAQDAFPEWSPSDRELFLISGTCGKCFDEMMGGFEDNEEE